MYIPHELVDQLWFSDPSTHLFHQVRTVRKQLDRRTLGIYGSRLDAANQKIRYAAEALVRVLRIVSELTHGEFIYFDDRSRLAAHEALESFLIFLRASMDLITAAWWAYHTDTTNLDSFHDLLKRLRAGVQWAPVQLDGTPTYWGELIAMFDSADFSWLSALVGQSKGQSLRDIAVHRSVLELDTIVNDQDKGVFVLALGKDSVGQADAWLASIYEQAMGFIVRVRQNIADHEHALDSNPTS